MQRSCRATIILLAENGNRGLIKTKNQVHRAVVIPAAKPHHESDERIKDSDKVDF